MSIRAIVYRPLTGDAPADATAILQAIRARRVFSTIDAVATPAAVDFRIRSGNHELEMGAMGAFDGPATVSARATVPPGGQLVLVHDGSEIAAAPGEVLEHGVAQPGAYRMEVRLPRAPGHPAVPWLVSNPIYLRVLMPREPPFELGAAQVRNLRDVAWRVEHDPLSQAKVSTEEGGARLDYRLGGGERASQFAALVADLPGDTGRFTEIMFGGDASAPMRVSVQLRFGTDEARWGRSVYLDGISRWNQISAATFRQAGKPPSQLAETAGATALLFVVDLTNAMPGAAGWFRIRWSALGVALK